MKKKKSDKPPSPDFKSLPFKTLKGFSPEPVSPGTRGAPIPARPKTTHDDDDDAALFLRAMDGARRLEHAPDQPAAAIKPKAPETSDDAPDDNRLFLQAMLKIGTTFREEATGHETDESASRSQSGRMRQLKRGTIRVSGELDLHGFLKDEALAQLERFIAGAFSREQKAVLVITGKGINSAEGPVLKGAVNEWLRSKGKGFVAEVCPAPRELGGSGAVVVFLKKK